MNTYMSKGCARKRSVVMPAVSSRPTATRLAAAKILFEKRDVLFWFEDALWVLPSMERDV